MRNVINIAARWLSGILAILMGVGITVSGLLMLRMGSLGGGAFIIVLAFVFFVPALFTLFGGSIKWMRWLWGGMTVLSLAAMFAPNAKQSGVASLIVSFLAFAISFAGRDKKVEEEEDASVFS